MPVINGSTALCSQVYSILSKLVCIYCFFWLAPFFGEDRGPKRRLTQYGRLPLLFRPRKIHPLGLEGGLRTKQESPRSRGTRADGPLWTARGASGHPGYPLSILRQLTPPPFLFPRDALLTGVAEGVCGHGAAGLVLRGGGRRKEEGGRRKERRRKEEGGRRGGDKALLWRKTPSPDSLVYLSEKNLLGGKCGWGERDV